jgi:hypothetical protein
MVVSLPNCRVGDRLRYEGLSIFPLFLEPSGNVEYLLSDEALAGGSVTVEEVSEAGSVPDLLVDNRGDLPVLLIEGEELRGAKQNRILNTSVLVAAHSKMKIPVSCVEQGRWRYSGRHFQPSGHHATAKLRRAVKASVGASLQSDSGHRADQGKVWDEVLALDSLMEVGSGTAAMSDTFETYRDRIAEYQNSLPYVEGASGLAAAIGGRIVSVDLFDKPSTCRRVWDRLLSGMVFDALEVAPDEHPVAEADVEQLLAKIGDLHWHDVAAVGEGSEFRAESPRGDHGSALLFEDVVVHGSVMPAV